MIWLCGFLSIVIFNKITFELAAEVKKSDSHPFHMCLLVDQARRFLCSICFSDLVGQLLYHLTVHAESFLEAAGSLDDEELLLGLLGGCVVLTVFAAHGD